MNNMLGAVGFFGLALIVGIYAYMQHSSVAPVPVREKRLFVAAYSLLSLAALMWSATFFIDKSAVAQLVFASDIVLIVATACMLGIIFDIMKPLLLLPLTIIGAGLITVRASVVPSTAYIADDLLIFNLSQVEAFTIGLIFLVAWLPATTKVVYLAFRSPRLLPFRNLVSFLFTSVILMTGFFLTARRPAMIAISFVSIILLFMILTGVQITLQRMDKVHEKRESRRG